MTASHSRHLKSTPQRASQRWALLCITALVILLAGCASSLPKDVDRPVSTALARPQDTPLGALVRQARPAGVKPGASGFVLIAGPEHAYSSRLALVENARQTLDLQYYAIHADHSTAQLLRAIVRAARRGVRVRVLLDDFHSTGPDAQIMRLAFVPNVEMRMFNPLSGSRASSIGRAWTLFTDFQRAQQRMHNKLFVADNAMAVMGGRNLGDAYFDAADDDNFVDLDILTAGPVVKDLSHSFDSYWNNVRAYPVQALISEKELLQLKAQFAREDSQPQPAGPGPTQSEQPMELNRLHWIWAQALVLADDPAKIPLEGEDHAGQQASAAAGTLPVRQPGRAPASAAQLLNSDSVVDGLLALIRTARQELLVVSPYFVPGKEIMSAFRSARDRGVRIRVLTNSLASNDAPLAHAGYARHRRALLEMGIELHELRSEPANLRSALRAGGTGSSGGAGRSRAMLHTKLLVVDGRLVAVGSMNLDMRSQLQNTELAVLIASRSFGKLASDNIDDSLPETSWRVEIDPEGRLIWRAPRDSGLEDVHSEPDASLGLRLMLQLLGPLAPESLL